MSKKQKSTAINQEKTMSREEQLERENELLRLEVSYLKKLKAFRENPDAFLEGHKLPSPPNLNKKEEGIVAVLALSFTYFRYCQSLLKRFLLRINGVPTSFVLLSFNIIHSLIRQLKPTQRFSDIYFN